MSAGGADERDRDWRSLWRSVRGAHALAGGYRARGEASSSTRGRRSADAYGFELCRAAGGRLRLLVGPAGGGGTPTRDTLETAVWGTPDGYFAWRAGGPVEALGPDPARAVDRAARSVPHIGVLLALLDGREPGAGSPEAGTDVVLVPQGTTSVLRWRGADATTCWELQARPADGALVRLASEVDPDFDVERAVTAAAAARGVDGEDPRVRARLEALLLDERAQAARHTLALAPDLSAQLDDGEFEFAPTARRV